MPRRRHVKLRPDQKPRYFVGIDVTNALDTIVWGHLWNAHFRWRNLLWELDKDPSDSQRRVDSAHPKLTIARLRRKHRGTRYADTCIMPQGIDPKETDPTNADIDAACRFMQTFILNPSADKATSSLNDTGQGVTGDVVYISSHGGSFGSMSGSIATADYIFELSKTASVGGQFNGPGWILLSNCSTLSSFTHEDWLKLMTGPNPLRGITGFQDTCPLHRGSANIFSNFIKGIVKKKNGKRKVLVKGLARGQTFIEAWSSTLRFRGMKENWVVVCHENAVGDNISDWNADKLKPIPPNSKILMFNEDNPTGIEVTPLTDPFEAFWSKGSTRITAVNRSNQLDKLKVGDDVSITVKPIPPATQFSDGTNIAITIVYIRTNYPKAKIDVNKIFTVQGQSGTEAPTTADLNPDSPGKHDSWKMVVKGTPSEVILKLRCDDLSMLSHSNYPLWLRVKISTTQHDFIRNGSIIVLK